MADTKLSEPKDAPKAFLYVIGPAEGAQKVGLSRDPAVRLSDLRVSNGLDLILHHTAPVDARDVLMAEKYAHALLWTKHARGEWFHVSPSQAQRAVDLAAAGVAEGRLPPGETLSGYSNRAKGRQTDIRRPGASLRLGARHRVALARYEAILSAARSAGVTSRGHQSVVARDQLRHLHEAIRAALGATTLTILRAVAEAGRSIGDLPGSYRQGHGYRARYLLALDHILCLTAD